jgi:integral membrane protein (TIGR01906 family)
MKRSRGLFLVLTVACMLAVLSAAIAVPILCRPFYYLHVSALHLAESTPWTVEEIHAAYNEMLDFCVLGKPFGTGVLAWSESGMSHFADCARLFRLDFAVLGVSVLALLVCLFLCNRGMRPVRPLGRGAAFWGGSLLAILFLVVAGLAAINFDAAFVIFHRLFFPGKSNWLFDPATDQIILILPEVFFRNCAILIVVVLLALCAALIVWDFRAPPRRIR